MEPTKKTITFKRLLEVYNAIHNQNLDSNRKDRLSMSIVQASEYLKYPMEQYNKKITALNQELCSVDSEGNFFLNEKGMPIYTKFTKPNQIKLQERGDKLLNEEVEIEVVYCTDLTRVKTLHLSFIHTLNGIVFDLTQEKIEELFITKEGDTPKVPLNSIEKETTTQN